MKLWKQSGFVICVCFLLVCATNCSYLFVEQNNCLKVSSPENLKGTYECAIGNLGIPQHGGSLSGGVVYPPVNRKGCKSFINDYQLSFKTKNLGSLPVLLLIDRGDCYLTLKAWNAQNAGAAGILIADDRPGPLTTSYMAEEIGDDYLENITIPSALISSSMGIAMKKALYNGHFVRLNLEWTDDSEEPKKNSDDEYDDEIIVYAETGKTINPMWRFINEPTPILGGILMQNIWSWYISLWTNGKGYNY